jgi:hypothetical protein
MSAWRRRSPEAPARADAVAPVAAAAAAAAVTVRRVRLEVVARWCTGAPSGRAWREVEVVKETSKVSRIAGK